MTVSARIDRTLDDVDRLPAGLRECVHDYGTPIVNACLAAGVTKPAAIRELVRAIWGGARQSTQRSGARNTIDFLLGLNGGGLSMRTLVRVLADNNLAIVPLMPTRPMLNASMAAVSNFNVVCTREEKHRRRLIAALRAAADEMLAVGRTLD